ncbi:MAG: 1,4-alpha-glucan branching protein [Verrucomicrobia bacterium]|nr:MAG: 1,4-alpha-glucan branching protein [Verrucomicrobiota bacterium]
MSKQLTKAFSYLVQNCTTQRYRERRVRARDLQDPVGRVPSRGAIANFRKQAPAALFCAALLAPAPSQGQSSRAGWGSTPYHDASGTGVTFRVWAPNATAVHVPGDFNSYSTTAFALGKELTNGVFDGVWSADMPGSWVNHQYKYFINSFGTNGLWKHDPRARKVVTSGSGDNDVIYDPTAFNWAGDNFPAPALEDLVIYEMHIGSFNVIFSGFPSSFVYATNKLDYLAGLGVNAIEVMPIAEFPGKYGWGYNPADPFAADNYAYGGPDGFKTLVKACHAHGIAVLLDVVHNHWGPGDLDLSDFDGWDGGANGGGIYFYQDTNHCCTPWGPRPNYSRQPVRDYIQDNFTMWLNEYHVDGFRWDTPGAMMNSDTTYIPEATTLISNITWLIHSNYPGKIDISEDVMGNGFDSTWDTVYPYAVQPVLTNSLDANRDMTVIANALTTNQRFGGSASLNRVAFLESHDVVGHGPRTPTAIDPVKPDSYRARKLSTLGAVVALTGMGVPMLFQGEEMLETNEFNANVPMDWTKTNAYSGVVQFYRDLIHQRRNYYGDSLGLKGDQCAILQVDNSNKLLTWRRWKTGTSGQDVVIVANFSGSGRTNYTVPFPSAGTWYVHLNSDSIYYGSDYGNIGVSSVTATGFNPTAPVTIGPYSAEIFSQVSFPPQLTIARTNTTVTVSWPIPYAAWMLDSTASFTGSSNTWTQVAPSQYHTNASTVSLTVSPASASAFYRLRRP